MEKGKENEKDSKKHSYLLLSPSFPAHLIETLDNLEKVL
jgi:hypothetical protein